MPNSHASCFKITCMKTGSYALMHFVVAIAVAYLLTRNWHAALAIGVVEPFVQTFAFYFHDRVWTNLGQSSGAAAGGAIETG